MKNRDDDQQDEKLGEFEVFKHIADMWRTQPGHVDIDSNLKELKRLRLLYRFPPVTATSFEAVLSQIESLRNNNNIVNNFIYDRFPIINAAMNNHKDAIDHRGIEFRTIQGQKIMFLVRIYKYVVYNRLMVYFTPPTQNWGFEYLEIVNREDEMSISDSQLRDLVKLSMKERNQL